MYNSNQNKGLREQCESELIDLLYNREDIYPCVFKYLEKAREEGYSDGYHQGYKEGAMERI